MLSRNNIKERLRKTEPEKQHYSIRKFTVGAASVLIGLSFLGMNNKTVKADTVNGNNANPADTPEPEVQKNENQQINSADANKIVVTPAEESSSSNSRELRVDNNQNSDNIKNSVIGKSSERNAKLFEDNKMQARSASAANDTVKYAQDDATATVAKPTHVWSKDGKTLKETNPISDDIGVTFSKDWDKTVTVTIDTAKGTDKYPITTTWQTADEVKDQIIKNLQNQTQYAGVDLDKLITVKQLSEDNATVPEGQYSTFNKKSGFEDGITKNRHQYQITINDTNSNLTIGDITANSANKIIFANVTTGINKDIGKTANSLSDDSIISDKGIGNSFGSYTTPAVDGPNGLQGNPKSNPEYDGPKLSNPDLQTYLANHTAAWVYLTKDNNLNLFSAPSTSFPVHFKGSVETEKDSDSSHNQTPSEDGIIKISDPTRSTDKDNLQGAQDLVNKLKDNQYVYRVFHMSVNNGGTDPITHQVVTDPLDFKLILSVDRDTGDSYYTVTNDKYTTNQGIKPLTQRTSITQASHTYWLTPFTLPNKNIIQSSVNITGDKPSKDYISENGDYSIPSRDDATNTNYKGNSYPNVSVPIPAKATETVHYALVDDNGNVISTDKIHDAITSKEGINGQNYDATRAVLKLDGYQYIPYVRDNKGNVIKSSDPNLIGTTSHDGIDLKGKLSNYKPGNSYVTGMTDVNHNNVSYKILHTVNDDGTENVEVFSQKGSKLGEGTIEKGKNDVDVAGLNVKRAAMRQTSDITLYYKAVPVANQKATIKFVDDDENQVEIPNTSTETKSGEPGASISFDNASQTVQTILNGHKYVYNGTTGEGITNGDKNSSFDKVTFPSYNDNVNDSQDFVVHFKHVIKRTTTDNSGNQFTKPATEIIHYVIDDSAKTKLKEPTKNTIKFTGTAYKDAVTGKYVKGSNDDTFVDQNNPVQSWTPENGTFAKVTSPATLSKDGVTYTLSKVDDEYADGTDVKEITGVKPGDEKKIYVYYTKEKINNPQHAKVEIIDEDDNNAVLGTDSATGEKDTEINFANEPTRLSDLISKGYVLDKADNNTDSATVVPITVDKDKGTVNFPKFDSDDNTTQSFRIYLKHGTKTKTETDKTTATVKYVVSDGKVQAPGDNTQTINWTKTDTVDAVTGDVKKEGTWTPEHTSYDSVTTPTPDNLKNYTPDKTKVDAITAIHGQNPINVVIYSPKPVAPEKADLIVYDDQDSNNPKELNTFNNAGNPNDQIEFSGSPNYVADLINRGYKFEKFVDDKGNTITSYDQISYPKYDSNDETDQHFKIYLVHDTEEAKDTKTTTSTVHYVISDGGTTAPQDNVQTITWTRPGTKDKVTGEFIPTPGTSYTTTDTYKDVLSPTVKGYEPDKTNVSAPTPKFGENPNTTVTYTPETPKQAEKANLKIYDLNQKISDRNYQQIGDTFNASGDDNTQITFTNAQTTIDSLIKAGYKVNSIYSDGTDLKNTDYASASKDWKFDEKPGQDQSFVVFLEHDTEDINKNNNHGIDLHHTLTETVHYMEDGTTNKVASDAHNSVDFDGKGTIDKVTGKLIEEEKHSDGKYYFKKDGQGNWVEKDLKDTTPDDFIWSTSNPFKEIKSPDIKGMHFTRMNPATAAAANGRDVKSYDVDHNTKDWEVTVYYAADPVYTHSAGLKIYTGIEGQAESEFTPNGSASINNAQPDSDIKFGYKDNLDKLIKAGYTVKAVKDITDSKNPKTLTVSQNYDEIESQFGKISSENKNTDQEFAIYLTKPAPKSQQQAQLIINDVTPGQEQQLGSYAQPGLEGDVISFTDANTQLQKLLNEGYVWDSATYNNGSTDLSDSNYNGFDYGKFDKSDDSKGITQKWVINLVHGYTPVDKDHPDDKDGYTKEYLDRKITRDVKYVDTQGNEMPDLSPEHQETEFTGSGYRDKVTGKWVIVADGKITGLANGLTWTPNDNQTFDAIDAKTAKDYHVISVSGSGVSGYTLGKDGAVGQQTVTKDTPSSNITVVYDKTPVQTNGSLTYIDDTTGKTLSSASFGGTVGQAITYTTAQPIADYVSQGYKLEKTDFTDGKETFNSDPTKNVFEVHLVHATAPIDPNHTPTPGNKVPNDPDHKYPNNTVPTDLTKDVTRTVSYQYEDGKQALPSVPQKVTFTGKGTIDLVTGNLVDPNNIKAQNGKITWTSDPTDAQYSEVPSIDTTKYSIIKVSENGTTANVDTTNGKVGSETVTAQSPDSTIVITLAKKQQQATLVFHDDTSNVDLTSSIPAQGTTDDAISFTDANKILSGYVDGENAKYKFVSTTEDGQTNPLTTDEADALAKFGKYDAKTKSFVIHLVHTTTHIDEDHPSHGYTADNLQRTVTTKVKYVDESGKQLADPVNKSVIFTASGDIDNVTGHWVTVKHGEITGQASGLTWNKTEENWDAIPAQTIKGYDLYSISGTKDKGFTIDDKTGAISAQKVTPNSADTNITIVYTPHKEATTGKLTYIDDTTGSTLADASFSGTAGQLIDYDALTQIKHYEAKGYDLVSDNFDQNGQTPIFDKDVSKNVFEIHLKHATTPVTPENPGKPGDKVPKDPTKPNEPDHKYPENYVPQTLTKTITRDVTYVMADGSKAPAPVHQTVTYNGNGVLDLVTGGYVTVGKDGKITPNGQITWTAANGDSFAATDPVANNGYKVISVTGDINKKVDHTTGAVAFDKVDQNSDNQSITIVLNKGTETPVVTTKTGTQTIHYVDENGNSIAPDTTNDSHTFTQNNGTWTENEYQYKGGNVPVIPGYVAVTKTFDGQKVTPDNPDATVTITYKKIGKIIPVDPSGNPIPGQSHPQFQNDPKDPTKVIDGKKPEISGYTPQIGKAGDPVSPDTDVTKDVEVVYVKDKVPTPQPTVPDATPSPTPQPEPATTSPAPTKPTEPKQPTKASTPDEDTPEIPDEPDIPETPKRHHHKKHTSTPKRAKHWSENNTPRNQSWNSNVAPHAQGLNRDETVMPNGEVVNSKGQVVGYVDKNGIVHHTLPQTSENQNEDLAAMIAGGVAVSMSLIGLVGVKKRRTN